LHTLPSLHDVPFAAKPFDGQVVALPLHVSSMSHSLMALRHTVPALPAGAAFPQAGALETPFR
jgi:hypothetical protein